MRLIKIIALSFFVMSLPQFTRAEVVPADKVQHFGISAAAETLCSSISKTLTRNKWASIAYCFVGINAMGAVKEALDPYMGNVREKGDVLANVAGSGLSAVSLSFAF